MTLTAPRNLILRIMPQGLAGRLLLVILAALAIAQIMLALVLQERKDAQVRDVIERQALVQTLMATQLLRHTPAADATFILDTFKNASACGTIVSMPPDFAERDHGSERFAKLLRQRLGDDSEPAPVVRIIRLESTGETRDCPQLYGPDELEAHGWPLQVTSYVPLSGGRWLQFTSLVDFPETENVLIAAMFLLASVAVGAVAVLSVRTQTRSLAALADASTRLGRGEAALPLGEGGPAEVRAAAQAFNTMQSRLKSFIDDRLKMLAAISHDLRTPLTTLRLKAEFVRDKTARQGLIDTIEEMTVIVESALAFTRAEAMQEPTKHMSLAIILTQLSHEYAAKGLKVELADCAHLTCALREVAFKRALRNLIDNALRYGGSATLSAEQRGRNAVIAVDDEGPGIAPEHGERVFEPFVRLETSRSKDTGGIGMGLAIARSIIKAHGGEILLRNRRSAGLRAEIVVPIV